MNKITKEVIDKILMKGYYLFKKSYVNVIQLLSTDSNRSCVAYRVIIDQTHTYFSAGIFIHCLVYLATDDGCFMQMKCRLMYRRFLCLFDLNFDFESSRC